MADFNPEPFLKLKKQHDAEMAEKKILENLIKSLEAQASEAEKDLVAVEEMRIILQEAARITQNNLRFQISSLVSTAMLAVNSSWPELEVVIESRRNQSEIDFYFSENNQIEEIPDASGVADVAATALRISVWSLNKNLPVFIFDEPFKHMSQDNSREASKMLKMLRDKLKIQIIIVSHDPEISDYADAVFNVTKKGAISSVKECNG